MNWTRGSAVSLFVAVVMLGSVAKLAHSQSVDELPCGTTFLNPKIDIVIRDVIFEYDALDDRQTEEYLRALGLEFVRLVSAYAYPAYRTIYRCSASCGGALPVIEGQSPYLTDEEVICTAFGLGHPLAGSSSCTIRAPATPGATMSCLPGFADNPPSEPY